MKEIIDGDKINQVLIVSKEQNIPQDYMIVVMGKDGTVLRRLDLNLPL